MARLQAPVRATFARRLLPGKVLHLSSPHGALLRGREGVLWATFESGGETVQDHVLQCGETLRLPAGSQVVLSACDSRYGLASFDWQPDREPVAARSPSSLAAWLRFLSPAPPQPA